MLHAARTDMLTREGPPEVEVALGAHSPPATGMSSDVAVVPDRAAAPPTAIVLRAGTECHEHHRHLWFRKLTRAAASTSRGATMVTMRFGIVEGEPGIFPDPVARVLRALASLVRRDEAAKPGNDAERKRPDNDAGLDET